MDDAITVDIYNIMFLCAQQRAQGYPCAHCCAGWFKKKNGFQVLLGIYTHKTHISLLYLRKYEEDFKFWSINSIMIIQTCLGKKMCYERLLSNPLHVFCELVCQALDLFCIWIMGSLLR